MYCFQNVVYNVMCKFTIHIKPSFMKIPGEIYPGIDYKNVTSGDLPPLRLLFLVHNFYCSILVSGAPALLDRELDLQTAFRFQCCVELIRALVVLHETLKGFR